MHPKSKDLFCCSGQKFLSPFPRAGIVVDPANEDRAKARERVAEEKALHAHAAGSGKEEAEADTEDDAVQQPAEQTEPRVARAGDDRFIRPHHGGEQEDQRADEHKGRCEFQDCRIAGEKPEHSAREGDGNDAQHKRGGNADDGGGTHDLLYAVVTIRADVLADHRTGRLLGRHREDVRQMHDLVADGVGRSLGQTVEIDEAHQNELRDRDAAGAQSNGISQLQHDTELGPVDPEAREFEIKAEVLPPAVEYAQREEQAHALAEHGGDRRAGGAHVKDNDKDQIADQIDEGRDGDKDQRAF